jgi:hypothetical protein
MERWGHVCLSWFLRAVRGRRCARSAARCRRMRRRVGAGLVARRWWVSFFLLAGMIGMWLLATPLLASPDEPQHLVRAASVARGTLLGRSTGSPSTTRFSLPAPFADVSAYPRCFAYRAQVPASCTPGLRRRSGAAREVTSSAGKYPPVYYAVVGVPSLLVTGVAADVPMRIVSGVLCAALLATAAAWATSPGGRLSSVGLAVSVTPMVLFMGAVVNPNGLEIAADAAVWVGLLVLVGSDRRPTRAFMSVLTAVTSVLLVARPISVFWAALSVVVALLLAPAGRLRALAGDVRVRISALALTAVTAAEAAWVLGTQSHALDVAPTPHHVSVGEALRLVLLPSHIKGLAVQLVGDFGWKDTPAPTATVLLWALAAAGLLVVGLVTSSWRHRAVTVVGIALCVLVPAVGEALAYPRLGPWWQGRYTLPLAVGVPLLAVAGARLSRRTSLPLGAGVAAAVALGQVLAFVHTLARYTVGAGHGLGLGTVRWHPPLPPLLLIALFCLLAIGWAIWLVLPLGRPTEPAGAQPLPATS